MEINMRAILYTTTAVTILTMPHKSKTKLQWDYTSKKKKGRETKASTLKINAVALELVPNHNFPSNFLWGKRILLKKLVSFI